MIHEFCQCQTQKLPNFKVIQTLSTTSIGERKGLCLAITAAGNVTCADAQYLEISSKSNTQITGSKFKVHPFLVKGIKWVKPIFLDSLDCESSNVLYLVTCLMCPDHIQFGGCATDMKKQLKDHKAGILQVLHVIKRFCCLD